MDRSYKFSLMIGIVAGYADLGILLFSFHTAPAELFWEVAPYFGVGFSGFTALLLAPDRPRQDTCEQTSTWRSVLGCYQNLSLIQIAGFVAGGFFFGALLSKTIKVIF